MAVSREALPENCALPLTDIGFGKGSKHWLCLDPFRFIPALLGRNHPLWGVNRPARESVISIAL